MSNSYYNHGAFPVTGSAATSANMRAELDLITAGFDKLPTLTSNANKIVVVNSSSNALDVITSIPPGSGGTGFSTYAIGDLLYADTTTTLAKLADVATGNALISGGVGVAPSWGKVGLTTHVSGQLGVANGGTGLASGTSGGVLYYSATGTLASSALLAANAIMLGGGTGAAPATTTTGTGVVTAIGNAVNTTNGLVTQSATLAASALLLGGGSATAISSTTTGTGVVTAIGNAVNTANGLVTQSATLAASALLLGGGSATAISSTTTGTGVVTAIGNNINTANGLVTQSATLPANTLLLGGGSATAISPLALGTAGQALVINSGATAPVWTDQFLSITYIFSYPAASDQGDLTIPFACTITEWTLLADATGSAVVDIWKDTYANYPPTIADVITASAKPTISSATKGQSSTLTGWTATITAGDTLRFNVNSVSGINRLTLSLKVKRT